MKVEVNNVNLHFKRFCPHERSLGHYLKRFSSQFLNPSKIPEQQISSDDKNIFYALKDVSFRINEGESVGLVGLNGAGKSTLMQVISGIYKPTTGYVRVNGSVTALLNLNGGFRGELTGLENIRLRGLLLNLSNQQIDTLIPEIIEFSGLEEFIDQPVRTYSSGMTARLGFAISTVLEPSVLLLDEILGVGDGIFAKKSQQKLRELMENAHAMLLCSHNLKTIEELCDRVIWLHKGKVKLDGPAETTLEEYQTFLQNISNHLRKKHAA